MALKIIFAGTPEFAVPSLQALLDSEHEVVAVYTQPDRPKGRGRKLTKSPVKELAEKYELPIEQPERLTSFDSYAADLMVVAAYGLLLPKKILEACPKGCINVHASLLPRWRGAAPIQYAILEGDKETGVSIMEMVQKLDAGAVFDSRAIEIGTMNSHELHEALAVMGGELLLNVVNHIERLEPVPQDESLVTYAPKITKSQAKIDWAKPAAVIARQVRAYYGWPVAYCDFHGDNLRIWEAELGNSTGEPGEFKRLDKQDIEVCCGEGALRLLKVQLPGGRVMEADKLPL